MDILTLEASAMSYPVNSSSIIEKRYKDAKESYARLGVDSDKALKLLAKISISMHCWQGDDVGGFEVKDSKLSGGIMATGGFPGKPRSADELRSDIEKAFSLIPGKHRLNLHAIYLETNGKFVDRDAISVKQFSRWLDWAKERGIKLDFNPTFFSHPKAASGYTLSSQDPAVRSFWVEHGKRCREIAADFAKKLNDISVLNFWIPDGAKDFPADRWSPRSRVMESLDRIFEGKANPKVKEAVEGKLFGIGSEEYVVGSHEFYFAYALTRKKLACLDMGHYHPTETIHDKLSAVLSFMPEALIHVSRPIRWDSDHVVICNDDLINLARELVRGDALDRVFLAPDFFDASINRIGAWVIGMRSLQRALVFALLEPVKQLKALEKEGRGAELLALSEECKELPHGAVWDYFCLRSGVPNGASWLNELRSYEKNVLMKR